MREVIRSNTIKSGWDALFIARRGSAKASYQELKRAADNLLRHSHLVDISDSTAPNGPKPEAHR